MLGQRSINLVWTILYTVSSYSERVGVGLVQLGMAASDSARICSGLVAESALHPHLASVEAAAECLQSCCPAVKWAIGTAG